MNRAAPRSIPTLFALAVLSAGAAAHAQVIERPALSSAFQLELAQQVRAKCALAGHDVAVAVADADGTVRTLLSGDSTKPVSVDAARRKARTAARTGAPTSALTSVLTEAPAYADFLRSSDPDVIFFGGGIPVRVRGQLAGAVGVGGAPGPQADEACATSGLAAVAGKLQ